MIEIGETWKWKDIYLVVTEDTGNHPTIRAALLTPLGSGDSDIHYGGTGAYLRDLDIVMLSGYQTLLPPLIGDGYWSLTSDQGLQGTYKLIGLKQEREQALNYPTEVYRATMNLIKEGPTKVLVATKTNGLYYCSDLRMYDSDYVPTWELLQGDLGIGVFACNVHNPLALQLCVVGGNTVYIRRPAITGDSWQEIFDQDDAETVTGLGDPTDWIFSYVEYNSWVSGEVYILGKHNKQIHFFYSTDYGSTWSSVAVYTSSFNRAQGGGNISISPASGGTYTQGDVIRLTMKTGAGGGSATITQSTDRGRTWAARQSLGAGGWTSKIHSHPSTQGTFYAGESAATVDLVKFTSYDHTTWVEIDGTYNAGIAYQPINAAMWISAEDTNKLYTIRGDELFSSDDDGSTWEANYTPGSDEMHRINGHGADEVLVGMSEDAVILTEWHVLASTINRGAAWTYQSGANADDSGTTDSIPYNCGGLSRNGIAIWGEPTIS